MGVVIKCSVCGRKYHQGSALGSIGGTMSDAFGGDNFVSDVFNVLGKASAHASGKNICPDCKRAQAFSGGGAGDMSGGAISAKAAKEAAEAEADRQEQRRRKEAEKAAIREIRDYIFPEDDNEFVRAVNNFCEDYSECSASLFQDKEFKNAYKKRIESELKLLKDSNPSHYEKLKSRWDEAKAVMKKKLKKRVIIASILFVVGFIVGMIIGCTIEGGSVGFGFGCGAGLGILGAAGSLVVGKTKHEEVTA